MTAETNGKSKMQAKGGTARTHQLRMTAESRDPQGNLRLRRRPAIQDLHQLAKWPRVRKVQLHQAGSTREGTWMP